MHICPHCVMTAISFINAGSIQLMACKDQYKQILKVKLKIDNKKEKINVSNG